MRADRLLQILLLLQRHRQLTAPDLAMRLEVSVRTVFRDMEALSTAGVPVYAERGRNGGCGLLPGYHADVDDLSRHEAQALFAWTGQATLSDLGLAGALRSALAKLSSTASDDQLRDAATLRDILVVDRRPWFGEEDSVDVLPTLRRAATAQRRLRLRYASPSHERAGIRTVDPWGLVENGGRWYLVASHRGQARLFRLSRITAADILDAPAKRPEDFDLTDTWRRLRANLEETGVTSTEVVVRVSPDVEQLVRQVCRPQLARGSPIGVVSRLDGWPVLKMKFRARRAAIGILLGFADSVVVQSPTGLRDDVVAAAQRVVALYG